MEKPRPKQTYKFCVVPQCRNTTFSAPKKYFFSVPKDPTVRRKWCKIIGRHGHKERYGELSPKSFVNICEDHFDLENDTENLMQYRLMKARGHKISLRLKKGVVPRKFSKHDHHISINTTQIKDDTHHMEVTDHVSVPQYHYQNQDQVQQITIECQVPNYLQEDHSPGTENSVLNYIPETDTSPSQNHLQSDQNLNAENPDLKNDPVVDSNQQLQDHHQDLDAMSEMELGRPIYRECRACLKIGESGGFVDIFLAKDSPWCWNKDTTIAEELTRVAHVQVSNTDKCSDVMCFGCCFKLYNASQFISMVQESDRIIKARPHIQSTNDNKWPKPIQLETEVNEAVLGNVSEVDIKQEVLSEEENDLSDKTDGGSKPDLHMEIKVEPEEIVQSAPIKVMVNGTITADEMKEMSNGGEIYYAEENREMESNDDNKKTSKTKNKQDSDAYITQKEKAKARKQRFLENMSIEKRETKRAKDREYYQKKRAENKTKSVTAMTEREKLQQRELWKINSKKYREKKNSLYLNDYVKDEPVSDEEDTGAFDLPLTCMLCAKRFLSVTGLKAHVLTSHSYKSVARRTGAGADHSPPQPKQRHICSICRRCFWTVTDLMVHETCHNKFHCYVCQMTFDSFGVLLKHRQRCKASKTQHCQVKTLHDVVRSAPTEVYIRKSYGNNIECTKCNEKFTDEYYMNVHNEVHHSDNAEVCKRTESVETDEKDKRKETISVKADEKDKRKETTTSMVAEEKDKRKKTTSLEAEEKDSNKMETESLELEMQKIHEGSNTGGSKNTSKENIECPNTEYGKETANEEIETNKSLNKLEESDKAKEIRIEVNVKNFTDFNNLKDNIEISKEIKQEPMDDETDCVTNENGDTNQLGSTSVEGPNNMIEIEIDKARNVKVNIKEELDDTFACSMMKMDSY